ncbi:type II secretion system F family protein [Anaerovibrio sp. RM50]|uniref:type II secretion system F family protein n=1 Tax=Anaerovibrio sp. RM50 TaxID=1200557 RepID=UPI0004887162|nr:type II secretion system F family protein [Anaerovibrio sp. RM50]
MNNYGYTVLDDAGKRSQGIIEAENRTIAYENLKSQGMIILELREKNSNLFLNFLKAKRKDNKNQKSQFYRQGAILMRAGLPINQVVGLMETGNYIGGSLKEKLSGGNSLANAMSACGRLYSSQEIAMVEAGEFGGNLEWVFLSLAQSFEKRDKLRQSFKMAMMYPLFLSILSLCSLTFIILGVLPVVLGVFGDLSLDLPWPTRILITISNTPAERLGAVFAIMVLLVMGIIAIRRSHTWGRIMDRILLRLPFWGRLWLMKDLGVLLGTLAMLLDSGIVIDKAMANCAPLCTNVFLGDSFLEMGERLFRGNSLQSCMKDELYPEVIRSMIAAGEGSGELGTMLHYGSEYCLDEAEKGVHIIETMAEPVIVAFLGIVIGFIVISIVWPMLELMTAYF